MTFTTEWADLLTWSCVFYAPTGYDEYGNKTWGAATRVNVHADTATTGETVAGREGFGGRDEVSLTIYFDGVTPQLGMKVTVPAGDDYFISGFRRHYDYDGNHHHWEADLEAEESGDVPIG